jgi:hypothetical protein
MSAANDPWQMAISKAQIDISRDVANLQKQLSDSTLLMSSGITNLEKQQRFEAQRVIDQVKLQAESKLLKATYIALPVVLGFVVWILQLGTNQKIDSTSKKLATRLALTEEFYKRKLTIYEELEKQMAGLAEAMKDLEADPANASSRMLVIDDVRKLSDTAKTSRLFLGEGVSEGLSDVTIMAAGMANPQPVARLQDLSDRIADLEDAMTKELQGQMGSLD